MNAIQARGLNQLLTQIVVNPKGPNVSVISLRFGKNVEAVEPILEKVKKLLSPWLILKWLLRKIHTTNSFLTKSNEN